METLHPLNAAQVGAGQGYTPGKSPSNEGSVVGNMDTNANSTVLGGSFDELKANQGPKEPEITPPAAPNIPPVGQPEMPHPEIEPQVDTPEIKEPLGDPGYASQDHDKDGSKHSDDVQMDKDLEGYNEINNDSPVQQPSQTAEPSVTEETEDFPR